MKIAYFHYLHGQDTALHHVRQFAEAVRSLGHPISVHAMNLAPTDNNSLKNRPGSDPLKLRRIGVGNIAHSVLALKLSGLLAPIFYLRGLWRARHVHSSSSPTL